MVEEIIYGDSIGAKVAYGKQADETVTSIRVDADGQLIISNPQVIVASAPVHYERDVVWSAKPVAVAADRYILLSPNAMTVNINGAGYVLGSQIELDLSLEATWDQVVTDYRVAANRAGKDFYIYACIPSSGSTPDILISANATYPTGYTADNTRKVGGFHCECVDIGTIAGHSLTGYLAGDVIPLSVWDLKHRSVGMQAGMRYDDWAKIWVGIYMNSGTGVDTASVYGAVVTDTRNWMDFVDDLAVVGCRLPTDAEFQIFARGSNKETNIVGSADPVTAGGYLDTAGRRMVSDGGDEGCCGQWYQWLQTPSARLDDGTAAGWYNLPGADGSFYTYGDNKYGNTVLLAGGNWAPGTHCGSRCRYANIVRRYTASAFAGRAVAESKET